MAALFAMGAVQWLAADAAATVYTISGLAFQPIAIRVYWQGLGSATDLTSDSTHIRAGTGFAVNTSSRRCVAIQDQDAAATMVCTTALFTDCLAATVTATGPVRDGALDLNSITADGFTLMVDDAAPVDITVFWEAWGGSDFTVAVIGDITEPGATGNQDYTATGFDTAGAGDQVVFFMGVNTLTADTVARNDAGLCVGFATSGAAAQNVVVAVIEQDNQTSTETRRYDIDGECLAQINIGVGVTRAQLTQFNANGFRLNWLERASTRLFSFLALKGGRWQAGSLTVNSNVVGTEKIVSGLPFIPRAVCGITSCIPERVAGVSSVSGGSFTQGTATSATAQHGQGFNMTASVTDAELSLSLQYDSFLPHPAFAGPESYDQDIRTFTHDGFIQRWVGPFTLGSQEIWSGYVAFGHTDDGGYLLVKN